MKIIDAAATHALLPYDKLADELRAVLHAAKTGQATAPPRLVVPLPEGGTLLLMPATDGRLGITKLVTVHPQNAARGLPSVQGEVVVFDVETGRRLFLLDGIAVTARRTAALSLLAAQLLAPAPADSMVIVGAGTQARSHAEAFIAGLRVQHVYIASRTPTHAAALAAHIRTLGADADVVESADSVLDRVTLIVTATTSSEPVLPVTLRDDSFVAAIGAYRHDMAELPPQVIHRAKVFVDTLAGTQSEAGDLIRAGVDWSTVTPLEDVVDGLCVSSGPVVFKSVGHALWDLAAARVAQRALGA